MNDVISFEEFPAIHNKNKKVAVVKYGEQYEVKFNIQKEDGYWKKETATYCTANRDSHDKVEARWRLDFPNGELISVTYL